MIKDIEKKEDYIPQTPKIGLDLGLKTLFATNKGDLFGRGFYNRLLKYDERITGLARNRQKQGLKLKDSKRYRNLVEKLREFLKNEVNRVINRIINLYKPQQIAVERLNFANPNLSKRLNRILSNFGKKVITNKLNSVQNMGINVVYVNSAYTSQVCSNCGYPDKNNRRSQEEFKCKLCGRKLNADVNGSRNILVRSSDEEINIYRSKKEVLHILVKRLLLNMEQRGIRHYSLAEVLIAKNKYFSNEIKGFS